MDIIAAIATGQAATAIGIVRISGEGCFALCDQVFRPMNGRPFSQTEPRKMIYGDVLDQSGGVLDRGLAVRFPGTGSYTGEDSAEFHCHGSPVVLREVLNTLFALGARQARPGEFTRRAFLNGRMDLTQAEAVIDLIDAETAAAAKNAMAQLDGALRRPLERIQDGLLDIASRFYAVVDYPDEDIEDIRPEQIRETLAETESALERLLATGQRGKVLKAGVRTAIVGRPNAGKSSLLNALAGYERAIVTDIPGTTRDTVEESAVVRDVLLRLVDTAGIRDSADAVEQLGVERSRRAVDSAQLVIAVIDGVTGPTEEDQEILELASRAPHWILGFSKSDLLPQGSCPVLEIPGSLREPDQAVSFSSVAPDGLRLLEDAIADLFPAGDPKDAGGLLTDIRQEDAVRRTLEAVRRAREALSAGLTPDAVVTDIEDGLNALGELTGRTAREDIVERIFSRFCVGK
ncbi:tRNA uridine-5-carboxymethylaminomethyl(34) synthesis GTPase MnmE [Dysosmobacter sp. HCP28S3_G4]|uniref:tRNA uridine-5-carboxymethylaminomethyl(34) synthesis GTPase MnmE n=1 Tax=Dysosmobacter sp. HCP28S3_G4 TaxID=3438938 RepID=UPI003F8AE275